MFAILAGGELFGFVGVLLALPVAAVVMVLLRYAYERYTQSEMYQEAEIASSIVLSSAEADQEDADVVIVPVEPETGSGSVEAP
jgi:hypothetical protein